MSDVNKKREEFNKDLEARRQWHKMCNFHYLSYKGISLLNYTYSKEILEGLGLQINVPRTFMTIESIRPNLDKPMDISAKWRNKREQAQAEKVGQMLKGEWLRSGADKEKAKAEFDALLYGSGYYLSYFENDEEEGDIFDGYDAQGVTKYKKGKQKYYEGMKIKWLNPYYVIPDRKAKTYEPRQHTSPRRIWIPSIWDYDEWVKECKKKGYKTEGMVKGGAIEELDSVKRTIDALYTRTITDLKTRDNGVITSASQETPSVVAEDAISVVVEYTPTETNTYAGANFTLVDSTKRVEPIKRIPIYCIKDYDVPGELEGIGESEVIRWQQYEENKVHNLWYLQVILNTVKRYGIVEELLVDPTEAKMSNPLKPIRLKYMAGIKVGDAVQALNQHSANDAPTSFLQEVKTIGQMATGQTDYSIGAPEGQAGTLGEANKMEAAGNRRVQQKIQTMEESGITPCLEMWLSAIPVLYTEELDYLLNDGTQQEVKFLPFNRDMNTNAKLIADYSVKNGVQVTAEGQPVKTLEDIFLTMGYSDVVFVSDLIGSYDITIKTALSMLYKEDNIRQFREAIMEARADNAEKMAMGMFPKWDTSKMTSDLLRQFSDIVTDVQEYELQQPMMPGQMPGQPAIGQQTPAQPVAQAVQQPAQPQQPANLITNS